MLYHVYAYSVLSDVHLFLTCFQTGKGILLILIGLIVRVVVALIVISGNRFSIKEKGFIAMAWLPKATVQVK